MILVITNTEDVTSDFIIREIRRRNAPFFRLNTDEFPQNIAGTAVFSNTTGPHLFMKRSASERGVDFSNIKSVLFRRPVAPTPHSDITDAGVRQFCINECSDFLHGLWLIPNCYWINRPDAIRRASYKMVQLHAARSLFQIPRTLITNDPMEAQRFLSAQSKGTIVKPLRSARVKDEGITKFLYTREMADCDVSQLDTLRLAPSILQEKVDKEFDIRVTVVGESVFAARIYTVDLPPAMPDWRFADDNNLHYSPENLPESIATACVSLTQNLGLEFGAIDLAVDVNGQYWFFEINPNGQWAWIEMELGLPISRSIVDLLMSPPLKN